MALEGLPRETQMLPSLAWNYPTKLLNLETQGELEAVNKLGEEREGDGGGTDLQATLESGQPRAKSCK